MDFMKPLFSRRRCFPPLSRLILVGAALFSAAAGVSAGGGHPIDPPAGEILVRFRDGTGGETIARLCRAIGLEVVRELAHPLRLLVAVPAGVAPEEALGRLRRLPEVEYAEPNWKRSVKEP